MHIGTNPETLSEAARGECLARALDQLDEAWMLRTLADAVDIPSPTGEEKAAAEYFASVMREARLEAQLQPFDERSANVVGRLGDRGGPSVLIFAPLDSATSGVPDEEVPWVGPELPAEHRPVARVDGDTVIGLGANNSKAHIVAAIAAARAIKKADVPLTGRIMLGFGAGGAPTNGRPSLDRRNIGLGVGCEYMLQQGVHADFAIVTKPGFTVQSEETGLCWFRIRIHGVQSYAGRKHLVPGHNPILHAARVIPLLEKWLDQYSDRHAGGEVRPQGVIGAIQGGWPNKPAFTPAACDIYVDVRISPRARPMQVWRELCEALGRIGRELDDEDLDMDCELIAAVTGPPTSPDNWIIESCVRAWTAEEHRPHQPMTNTSGQTEAVILRRHGIPTARIGLPPEVLPNGDHTMGRASSSAMLKLASVLLRTMIDTCTRSLDEVGLARQGEQER